ncbi:MAG: pyruvate carboxylase [Kordiimonas sp.]|nr:pyruvate carboxylase [Kordiimonas sp.]
MSAVKPIKKILVANRGEIAIRVFRACHELGITSVAIYAHEDRLSLHRFKANEAYQVGEGKGPVEAYLDIEDILRIAKEADVDAIHPGYGFLSENPDFAELCAQNGLNFIGPSPETMRSLSNKVSARNLAISADVPVIPATSALPDDGEEIKKLAADIGYPVMIKASWGGGGRGMRAVDNEADLLENVEAARREAGAAFGNNEVYLEKKIDTARHVEVQILGDTHGQLVHLFERDCSVQRRHQKVVERAPAPYLNEEQRQQICASATQLGRKANYVNAGTVEFLQDAKTGKYYFIEVNPRIQVEHTVTEQVTGLDIVKAQIIIAGGGKIGTDEVGVPLQDDIKMNGHALQCRITTEDPTNNFIPDYGKIITYRSPAGPGIRLDAGTAYSGAVITRFYDSLLVKVTASGHSEAEAISRMNRALSEFRIRGIETNVQFLRGLLAHEKFLSHQYTTRFVDETPELFDLATRRGMTTKLLHYIGDIIVNGNPEVKNRPRPTRLEEAKTPRLTHNNIPDGTRQKLQSLGAKGFADWMKAQSQPLVTDTSFRDAHQSLIATRMRSRDLQRIAPFYARNLHNLLSVEDWGGATFDVAMRFLKEDPWERLANLADAMPNILHQMLLRASNGVGYTNYPDNVVRYFTHKAADAGVDIFRIFDSLNWTENMKVAIDAAGETGKLVEAAICYTGDLLDPKEGQYTLDYYVKMAQELEAAGAHILGIKDMAGLCKAPAAYKLVSTLKEAVDLPIHFHTHDTSGVSSASVMAAVNAGVDAFDAAMDSMSGLTAQPNLGSIVAGLKNTDKDTGLDLDAIRTASFYWEQARANYAAFESDIRSGTSDVYLHGMPGGQYTNLRQQARSLGIEHHWPDVARAYADVNDMFGNIVKVTPSSKVVGDMALMMVTSDLTREQVEDPDHEVAFPDSVVSFFRGELGQPPAGFPATLQKKVLGDEAPYSVRPGSILPAADLDAIRAELADKIGDEVTDYDLASYLMYPQVFLDYVAHRKEYGNVSLLPTSAYFYGMQPGDEITVTLAKGVESIIRFLAVSEINDEGERHIFFELNVQPRSVRVKDMDVQQDLVKHEKADPHNENHLGAPMPGLVSAVNVISGQEVKAGDTLLSIEAMKMVTAVRAERDAVVGRVVVEAGQQVDTKDLLLEFKAD